MARPLRIEYEGAVYHVTLRLAKTSQQLSSTKFLCELGGLAPVGGRGVSKEQYALYSEPRFAQTSVVCKWRAQGAVLKGTSVLSHLKFRIDAQHSMGRCKEETGRLLCPRFDKDRDKVEYPFFALTED
jgi:hypothetical protein